MSVLSNHMIRQRLEIEDDDANEKLVVTPLLEETQLNGASIDLRLGTEFKVAIPTRTPLIGIVEEPIDQFFQSTFRSFGDDFILYPNQLVLVNSFEYIKIPQDTLGMISTRSSLNRIGLNVTSIVHPGYAGTLTLQLENNGVSAIKLKCGMRLIQLVLFLCESTPESYIANSLSKYISNTSPVLSQINRDSDLDVLKKFS